MKLHRMVWLLVLVNQAYAQSGWKQSSLNSPMGDNSGIVLNAKQVPVGSSAIPQETGLAIQCTKKDHLEAVLATGLVLNSSGSVNDENHRGAIGGMFSKHANQSLSPVRVRFDQQKIRREEWVMGASPSNLFVQNPKKFVDELIKDQVHEVLIEVHPVGGDPVVFKFDVAGLAEYKTKLRDSCGY